MKNLLELKEKVSLTELSKKINIKGETKIYPVYRIAIEELYYNNQNDRIASQISEYMENNNLENFDVDYDNLSKYNDIVGEFIKASNMPAFMKTKNNIERFSQLEAGVVTTDGRVIDGNRRFTCLRELSKDNPQFAYFNAVILDDGQLTPKEIKTLELEIQHGQEEKVGYDIIDRCAGIYKDLIKEGHMFTREEYARSTDEKISDIDKLIEKTNLIVEFLEFMNAPEKFHVARNLEIDGPISELIPLKKNSSEEEWNKIKIITFDNIITKTDKDITRYIRDIKKYVKDDELDNYFEEHRETSKQIHTKLENMGNVTIDKVKEEIRSNEDLKENARKVYEKYTDKGKLKEVKEQPIKLLEKVSNILDEIDFNAVNKMSIDEKDRFIYSFNEILNKLNNMKGKI
ncbi:MAG: hypothetical protein J6K42_03655 [Clostridia bacterium]|nr:hypothetical protein [Clostridia bacterium]